MALTEYKFVVQWTLAGEDIRQIGLAGLAEPTVDEALIEGYFDTLWGTVKLKYGEELTLTGYSFYEGPVRDGNHWDWGDAFRVTPRSVPGTSASTLLPPQCAVVVSFPFPAPHKRHRGRIYMPAPTAISSTSAGRFLDHNTFATAWEVFLEACAAAGWHPAVLAWINAAPSMLLIQSLKVDDVFDTQRRRAYDNALASSTKTVTNPAP